MRIGGQGCVTCPLTRERHPLVILQTVSSKKFWKKFCRYNPTDNIIVGNNVLIIVKHYGSIFRIDENRLILQTEDKSASKNATDIGSSLKIQVC